MHAQFHLADPSEAFCALLNTVRNPKTLPVKSIAAIHKPFYGDVERLKFVKFFDFPYQLFTM
jgi:hypothetical protein